MLVIKLDYRIIIFKPSPGCKKLLMLLSVVKIKYLLEFLQENIPMIRKIVTFLQFLMFKSRIKAIYNIDRNTMFFRDADTLSHFYHTDR